MKTFALTNPPKTAGIYALKNRVTGHVYIGQASDLMHRYTAWKGYFRTLNGSQIEFAKVVRSTNVEDWEFRVLISGVDRGKLWRLESRAIAGISKANPSLCLNIMLRAKPNQPSKTSIYGSKSVITGPSGEMTHREVALALGVRPDTIKERARYWRDKGIFQLTLEDLRPQRSGVHRRPTLKPF